jgi:hypothetical protein
MPEDGADSDNLMALAEFSPDRLRRHLVGLRADNEAAFFHCPDEMEDRGKENRRLHLKLRMGRDEVPLCFKTRPYQMCYSS